VSVAVSLGSSGEVDLVHHVEVGVGLVDAGVDNVGVDSRNSPPAVTGLRRARIGGYLVDAPGQPLGCDRHGGVALDVGDVWVSTHLRDAVVRDIRGEPLQGIGVDETHLEGRLPPIYCLSYSYGVSNTLLEHDYVAL
jgi:hypothetical protein